MRYDKSWLEDRIAQIHNSVNDESQLKDLRFSGSGVGGWQIYLYMGGPIKVIQRGTLRECLSYLDGILFTLQTLKQEGVSLVAKKTVVIHQISDDSDEIGLLRTESDGDCSEVVEAVTKSVLEDTMFWEQEDPYAWFWEELEARLLVKGILAERTFIG